VNFNGIGFVASQTLWLQKPAGQVCAIIQYWNPSTEQ